MTDDPRIWYQARDGKVYDEEGHEAATARTANGRDLERHAEALETAKHQRAAMERAAKLAPELIRPAGSHHVELASIRSPEPFAKEELYPILELQAPRVGLVRATMSADRYVASTETGDRMGPWRIVLRDVRTPDAERPELPHLGREAAGIGPATRDTIQRACEPIVRAWLETDDYAHSRRRAAVRALLRTLETPADYTLTQARKNLDAIADELAPGDRDAVGRALEQLEGARQIIDAINGSD